MAFISTKKTFFAAAASGDLAEVKYGLETSSYGINLKDAAGNTATHIAAVNGQMEVLKYLLKRRPDLEIKNNEQDTPLLAAAAKDKSEAALALVAAGADVNTHDAGYTYPLHWVAHFGDLDLAKAMVEKGVELDVRTRKEERTPTYYAVSADRGAVLEFLVSRGARTDIPGTDNKTPYDIAKEGKPRLQKIIDETPRAKIEEKPAVEAVAAVIVAAPAAAAPPANENKPVIEQGEKWVLMSATTVAKTGSYPALGRKLTEIFNFETLERMTISENLKSGAESLGNAEPFATVPPAALKTAMNELLKLVGKSPVFDDKALLDQSPIARLGLKP